MTTRRVPARTLAAYALPNVPHALALLPVVNFIPAFYSDDLGLPLAMVGLMLVLTRITDIITDPLVGNWSDRTRTRWGRRKPWIVAGLPVMMVSAWFLFVPQGEPTLGYLFVWLFLLYLGFTLVDLPYAAWGAELSSDYDERSRVAGWRGAANSIGSLVTLAIPVVVQALGHRDTATTLFWMALFFVVFQPLCFAVALRAVPEPPPTPREGRAASFAQRLAVVRSNRPFIALIAATFLLVAGLAVGATLNKLVFTHVALAPDLFVWTVFFQNLVMLAALPLWLAVARTMGKHRAMAAAALAMGAISACTWLIGPGDGLWLAAAVVALGAPLGAALFLGASMTADIVDRDLLESGQERTGLYFAFVSMATKASVVVGVLIGTAIPGLAGFQPSDAAHSPESLATLLAVYAFACPALALPAAWLLWRYPLDRAAQQDLRRRIDARRAGGAHA